VTEAAVDAPAHDGAEGRHAVRRGAWLEPTREIEIAPTAVDAALPRSVAVAAAYAQYAPAITAYLRRMVGDGETAADLTATTFEKALRSWDRTSLDCPGAWLFRIATNSALDVLRRRQRIRWQPLEVLAMVRGATPVAADAPERQAIRTEQRDLLRQELRQLPARHRTALLLHEGQACSYREVALALGISPAAAKQLLFRARQDLRVRYLALGGEPLEG
jgi:RNA polymerase sigma-70 factor (ECF subfamily)